MEYEKDSRSELVPLDVHQIKAITFIDQHFFEKNGIPSFDAIAEVADVIPEEVEKWFSNRQFINALSARGVDLSLRQDPESISPLQAVAVHLVFNTEDRRSLTEKLKSLNVPMPTWQGWVAQPRFRQYIRSRALQTNDVTATMALLELDRAVADGDHRAVELALRMGDLYSPKSEVNINVESVIINVIEIIQKHVQDPLVLQAIANDMEELSSGRQKAIGSG